ncbi:MAG TPA: DUF3187 family protein [Steroidobacteraceae bacterium]|nr:DUF3187 family protein [Steroidobacteraceae bacterium]
MTFARRTAACACVLGAVVAPTAEAEPFLVRNQHPFVALFGLPAPLPARLPAQGGGAVAGLVNWSNFATTGTEGDLGYTLDGEVFETRVIVDHSLGARFALHGELAYRSLSEGSLDGAIDQWHDFFSLPDGSRPRLPEEQLLLEYRNGAGTPFRVDGASSGLADVPLALGYQWHASDTGALATWLSIKAPTGSAEDLTGSGAVDVALSLAGERRVGERWQAFGQANLAWLGEGELLPELQEDVAWSLLGGLSWNAWRGLDLAVQVEVNSAVLDSGLDDLDGAATVLTFGGSYRTAGGWRFDLAVSEDVQTDASPDVVFNLGVRHGF